MTSRALLLPLAAALLVGCAQAPVVPKPTRWPELRAYRSPALARGARRRALVLPFRHDDHSVSQWITAAFTLELEKKNAFDLLPPDGLQAKATDRLALWDGHCLDVRALTALRRRLKVDAIVVGHVLHYRPYDPPVLSVRVQVVSTHSGGVLWGAEGAFDAREAGVQRLMQRFHYAHLEETGRGLGWRLLLSSPRHFAQFVAHELVATLSPDGRDRGPAVASNTL